MKQPSMPTRISRIACIAFGLAAALPVYAPAAPPEPSTTEDAAIADSLAAMLRAGRTVISANQGRINDPAIGPKGLDGKTVLAATIAGYRTATGNDPLAIDPASRQGILLRAQMDAIVAVMDNAQPTLNALGVGFKGFIPAIFARLVNEEFARRADGKAVMKVTAPPDLVRNRTARPDAFELQVITTKFLSPTWQRGAPYSATVAHGSGTEFRVMVPEYYAASCLSCHGDPKGSLDVTGYPREGRHEGDLGGVISITLLR
jgi:Protein of unknown function (DUF3365)